MRKERVATLARRYDLWVDWKDESRSRVAGIVAGLLGIDVRQAGKLLDSGSPVCQTRSLRRARFLRSRFGDLGLTVRLEPEPGEVEQAWGDGEQGERRWSFHLCLAQAVSGFTAGMMVSLGITLAVPPLVGLVPWIEEPSLAAVMLAPLVVSSAVGACWGGIRLASILWTALSAIVAGTAMAALATVGSWVIERWLGRDTSSDVTSPLVALAFGAICIALAAPLAAVLASFGRSRN